MMKVSKRTVSLLNFGLLLLTQQKALAIEETEVKKNAIASIAGKQGLRGDIYGERSSLSWDNLKLLVQNRNDDYPTPKPTPKPANAKPTTLNPTPNPTPRPTPRPTPAPSISMQPSVSMKPSISMEPSVSAIPSTSPSESLMPTFVFAIECSANITDFENNETFVIFDGEMPTMAELSQLEATFTPTYNSLRAGFCDPFERTVDTAEIIDIEEIVEDARARNLRESSGRKLRGRFRARFRARGSCRGCRRNNPRLFDQGARRLMEESFKALGHSVVSVGSSSKSDYHARALKTRSLQKVKQVQNQALQATDTCFCDSSQPPPEEQNLPTEEAFTMEYNEVVENLDLPNVMGVADTVDESPPDDICDINDPNTECCSDADCGESTTCQANVCVGTGSLVFRLMWFGDDDLDLHVITPLGNEIFFGNTQADGGMLDRDSVPGPIQDWIENIFWTTEPPAGNYTYYVDSFSQTGMADPWDLEVIVMDEVVASHTGNGTSENFTYVSP